MPIVCLTGFMGSGKSSVGKELAILLDWDFYDLDSLIEEREGRSIPRIFAEDGEEAFRQDELAALKRFFRYRNSPVFHSKRGSVLALGGGTVMQPEAVKLIHRYSRCIYLQASVGTLVENLSGASEGRPMLAGDRSLKEKIESLMALREERYREAADVIVATDGLSPAGIAERICELIESQD